MVKTFYMALQASLFATSVAALDLLEWNDSYAIISHEGNELHAANKISEDLCGVTNQFPELISQDFRQDGTVHTFYACFKPRDMADRPSNLQATLD